MTNAAQKAPSTLRTQVYDLKHDMSELREQLVHHVAEEAHHTAPCAIASRVLLLIDGDPTRDVVGLRQRVATIEGSVATIQEDKKSQQNTLRGIAIGLSLTALTGAGTFVTMLMQVFK